jgi:hypothetical protein
MPPLTHEGQVLRCNISVHTSVGHGLIHSLSGRNLRAFQRRQFNLYRLIPYTWAICKSPLQGIFSHHACPLPRMIGTKNRTLLLIFDSK